MLDTVLLAVGLSMDAFAVSVCKGLCQSKVNWKRAFVTALFFGGFQALMPFLGWLLGSAVQSLIESFDHWIAFVLLAAIGAKMIWDAFHEEDECKEEHDSVAKFLGETFVLAIATSIDALVAGISFNALNVDVPVTLLVIGLTTFGLSLIGTYIGNKFGSRFEKWATIAGGSCLILLGLKVLVEGLL